MKMIRKKLSRRGSRRLFTRTALKVHRFNVPMLSRGGIRF